MAEFNTQTFLRQASFGVIRILHAGTFAKRMGEFLAGLLTDTMVEGARQAMRFSLPLGDTPIDALPYMLRSFGLPFYSELYETTITRLRSAWDTHVVAGAQTMLEAEFAGIGLENPAVDTLGSLHLFGLLADNAEPDATWGTFDYNDGTVYGGQIDPIIARDINRLLRYFKPARVRWLGLTPNS